MSISKLTSHARKYNVCSIRELPAESCCYNVIVTCYYKRAPAQHFIINLSCIGEHIDSNCETQFDIHSRVQNESFLKENGFSTSNGILGPRDALHFQNG